MFDYEDRSVYNNLFLVVEDNGRTGKRVSSPSDVIIQIKNLDDEPTVFEQATYSEWFIASGAV